MKNRAVICVFWERNGHLRRYVEYYLEHLKKNSQRLIVVINGNITVESEQILKNLAIEYYCRENKGLDFGGYKYGIEKIGYDNLSKYDDLILTNTTCYGPVYPLEEMFETMDKKDCDFWGITEHPQTRKIKKHLQSYFLVFRNSIIKSEAFKKYWKNLPIISDYKKVVEKLETKLTLYFENFGYQYLAYIPTPEKFNLNPMLITDKLLTEHKLPLVKRKAICGATEYFVKYALPNSSQKIITHIKQNSTYDINFIYNDLISSFPMSDIREALNLNWVLQTENTNIPLKTNKKIALILHIYYPDLVDYCLNYAKSMPENSDIYIVTSREDTKKICEERMSSFKCNHYEIRLKPNQGRDVSAYLVTCRDVFDNYDYICCMHDKKTPSAKYPLIGKFFSDHCFDSCLFSKGYVKQIINIFEQNSKMGLLCPFPMLKMNFYNMIGDEIGNSNYSNLYKLYSDLNLTIPFDKTPIAPLGAMFWIRGKALQKLFSKPWKYEDFPKEPLAGDGTISHAIERLYPYVVQEARFFSGYIQPLEYAQLKFDLFIYNTKSSKKMIQNFSKKNSKNLLRTIFAIENRYIFGQKIKFITILGLNFSINI